MSILIDWNKKINLVSRKSIDLVFPNHFIDSMHISDVAVQFSEKRNIFDIGTGAGFPGLVFAIRYPERKISLYERIQKKQKFLKSVVEDLRLGNVKLYGEFNKEMAPGLFLSRAVCRKEMLMSFFERRISNGSRFLVCLGEKTPTKGERKSLKKIGQFIYELPMDCGRRKIEVFEMVSRGTIE